MFRGVPERRHHAVGVNAPKPARAFMVQNFAGHRRSYSNRSEGSRIGANVTTVLIGRTTYIAQINAHPYVRWRTVDACVTTGVASVNFDFLLLLIGAFICLEAATLLGVLGGYDRLIIALATGGVCLCIWAICSGVASWRAKRRDGTESSRRLMDSYYCRHRCYGRRLQDQFERYSIQRSCNLAHEHRGASAANCPLSAIGRQQPRICVRIRLKPAGATIRMLAKALRAMFVNGSLKEHQDKCTTEASLGLR